eukprot:TRINITY_DN14277_c0_g1_i1.p2 TRINITY_DN14277_c0_g1~~TRINITY_DN14277_c0_g1_i1.p2  ORF type:complete len:127 (+),score=41.11 TRINITY_DN14277_c0_g1_i1:270-650(+)
MRGDMWHGDVKPHNFLSFTENMATPAIKLADFGKARRVDDPRPISAGTQAYMPPQMILDPESVRAAPAKVDTWSLGVCLAEVAHGALLFDTEQTVAEHLADLRRAPSDCMVGIRKRLRISELSATW